MNSSVYPRGAFSGKGPRLQRRAFLASGAAVGALAAGGTVFNPAAQGAAAPLPSLNALRALRPATYPSLGDTALGLLEYQRRKATAVNGDWSLWEYSTDFDGKPGVAGIEAEGTQYDLYFSSMATANAVNVTPAYRGLADEILGGIVEKGLSDRSWRYWTENTKGAQPLLPVGGGNDGSYAPYAADPISTGNAMYVGNFAGALGYHALMTNDRRFDQPMTFTYEGEGVEIDGTRVRSGQSWEHSYGDIVRTVASQVGTDPHGMMMCQLPTYYLVCNVSVSQGILAYDRTHGTDFSEVLYRPGGMFDKIGEEFFFPARSTGLPLQGLVFLLAGTGKALGDEFAPVIVPLSASDLFIVVGTAATKPEWARDIYRSTKPRWFTSLPDGTGFWRSAVGISALDSMLPDSLGSLIPDLPGPLSLVATDRIATMLGAASAAYVGDTDVEERSRAWIDKYCQPRREGAMLYYKLGYSSGDDALHEGVQQACALVAHTAESGAFEGFNIDRRRFVEPTLSGVDSAVTQVRTATFDRSARALVMRLRSTRATRVTVTNLKAGTQARVLVDRRHIETVRVKRSGAIPVAVPSGDHDLVVGVQ